MFPALDKLVVCSVADVGVVPCCPSKWLSVGCGHFSPCAALTLGLVTYVGEASLKLSLTQV